MKIKSFYGKIAGHSVIITGGDVEFDGPDLGEETLIGALLVEDDRNRPVVAELGYNFNAQKVDTVDPRVEEADDSGSVGDKEEELKKPKPKAHAKKK